MENETGTSKSFTLPEVAVVRFNSKNYIFINRGTSEEKGVIKNNYEMVEVTTGTSEAGVIQVNAVEKGLDFENARIVIKDANTLLAAAKNSEEGCGQGH